MKINWVLSCLIRSFLSHFVSFAGAAASAVIQFKEGESQATCSTKTIC